MATEPLTLETYLFKYIAETLDGKSTDEICRWYVENFVFKNGDYLKNLIEKYHWPDDILKLHKRIIELSKGI